MAVYDLTGRWRLHVVIDAVPHLEENLRVKVLLLQLRIFWQSFD